MHDIHAAGLNEVMGKCTLRWRYLIAPVAAPVDRGHEDVAVTL